MTKMVYFHPALNSPPLYGSQVSSFEILKTLKEVGYKIHLFIVEKPGEPILSKNDNWGFEDLKIISQSSMSQMRCEFSSYIEKVKPKVIFLNYTSWDEVLDHKKFKKVTRIIYNHHFCETIRRKWYAAYHKLWGSKMFSSIDSVPENLIDLNFLKLQSFGVDQGEFSVYDKYDYTLAIPDAGLKEIQDKCKNTQVISLKATLPPQEGHSEYGPFAILPLGTNSFNLQGYCFFAKKILPLILEKYPFFRVKVFGLHSKSYPSAPNVFLKGFCDNLHREYFKARFLLCPTFNGTGQQIKVLDAMSCSLPTVLMENSMQHIPFTHGVEGFIAKDENEFAQYCLLLFSDINLAKEMGRKAREKLISEYSSSSNEGIFSQWMH